MVTGVSAPPVTGLVDGDFVLMEADSLLAHLHASAGGTEGGRLAVEPLVALCQLTRRLGSGLSRPLTVADGEHAIRLWVETRIAGACIAISIVSWSEVPAIFLPDSHDDGDWPGFAHDPADTNAAVFGQDEAASRRPGDRTASGQGSASFGTFGPTVSEAIRRPLARIIANAETIGARGESRLRENYAGYARDIAHAARHLQDLVSDLADLEVIERAGFTVEPDRIDLSDVASRAAGLLSVRAADHRITLVLPVEHAPALAVGEFRRALQILINLIGNAIHYSPAGSTVTVACGGDDAMRWIIVSDQGPGIAPADSERVFEKFERLGRSGGEGSGLGLYISRRLARTMGGDLSVRLNPGGGAAFRLTLPASA